MSTTKEELREWIKRGKSAKATHMIVVCDTFDHEDYPVSSAQGKTRKRRKKNIQAKTCSGSWRYTT